jgi:hypothetical protein
LHFSSGSIVVPQGVKQVSFRVYKFGNKTDERIRCFRHLSLRCIIFGRFHIADLKDKWLCLLFTFLTSFTDGSFWGSSKGCSACWGMKIMDCSARVRIAIRQMPVEVMNN